MVRGVVIMILIRSTPLAPPRRQELFWCFIHSFNLQVTLWIRCCDMHLAEEKSQSQRVWAPGSPESRHTDIILAGAMNTSSLASASTPSLLFFTTRRWASLASPPLCVQQPCLFLYLWTMNLGPMHIRTEKPSACKISGDAEVGEHRFEIRPIRICILGVTY